MKKIQNFILYFLIILVTPAFACAQSITTPSSKPTQTSTPNSSQDPTIPHDNHHAPVLLPIEMTIEAEENSDVLSAIIKIDFKTPLKSKSKLEIKPTPGNMITKGNPFYTIEPIDAPKQLEFKISISGTEPAFEAILDINDNGMFISMSETYPSPKSPRKLSPQTPMENIPKTQINGMELDKAILVKP